MVASRFPLWAKYPRTPETLTLHALLVAQFVTSSLLLPNLVNGISATLAAVATGWPFALVAAGLSSVPVSSAAWAESFVSLWLVVLWLWRAVLTRPRAQAAAVAITTCLAVSGPLYRYLLTDFGADPASNPDLSLSPLTGSLSMLAPESRAPHSFVPLLLISVPAAVIAAVRLRRRRRDFQAG